MLIKRDLEDNILKGAHYFPVIAILGPRQSGKTTLAKAIFKNHTYVSLEDPDVRLAARTDPRTFLIVNPSKHGIIIDEFQRVPELLSYIQTMIDHEKIPGFFILTGSQNFWMNKSITQSLAGRVSIHTLLPLSIHELRSNNLLPNEIEEFLYKGCYPAIYSEQVPADLLYKNYIKTYLERDVRDLINVGDLDLFQTFLVLCAARIGQKVNLQQLANETGISPTSVERWLTVLEASYIAFRFYGYAPNEGKRLVKTPKIFFYDPGLVCHLLRLKQEELALHPNRGGIFESLIISDIAKYHFNHGLDPRLYFWQDKAGREIDCLVVDGNRITPIEIKASRTLSGRFFENLNYWRELPDYKEHKEGFVVYAGSESQPRLHTKLISWQLTDTIFENPKNREHAQP